MCSLQIYMYLRFYEGMWISHFVVLLIIYLNLYVNKKNFSFLLININCDSSISLCIAFHSIWKINPWSMCNFYSRKSIYLCTYWEHVVCLVLLTHMCMLCSVVLLYCIFNIILSIYLTYRDAMRYHFFYMLLYCIFNIMLSIYLTYRDAMRYHFFTCHQGNISYRHSVVF